MLASLLASLILYVMKAGHSLVHHSIGTSTYLIGHEGLPARQHLIKPLKRVLQLLDLLLDRPAHRVREEGAVEGLEEVGPHARVLQVLHDLSHGPGGQHVDLQAVGGVAFGAGQRGAEGTVCKQ